MGIRNYSNEARPLSLSARVESDDDTIPVAAPGTADYPAPPFLLAAERGTSREEVMLCTAKAAFSFTVDRGFDASGSSSHEAGTSIEHTVAAIDFREANAHVNDVENHWHPGDLKQSASANAQSGWLFCTGAVVSATTYSDLHDEIGDAYNTGGEGAGNFRLPDFRQAFAMGKADAGTGSVLGSRGGFKDGSILTHTHPITDPTHNHSQNGHNHTQDAHKHTLTGGRHAHAFEGDYGFRVLVSHGSGEGTLVTPGNAVQVNGVKYTRTDIDTEDILNPNDPGDAYSALDMNNQTPTNQAATATNNAIGTGISVNAPGGSVVVTDRNLPPWVAINFLIKV